MNQYSHKSKPTDDVEEGELSDDSPNNNIPPQEPAPPADQQQSLSSNEIIFQTVIDSDLQKDKKRKSIYKQQKSKRYTPLQKDRQRINEKDNKKNDKYSNTTKTNQQRQQSQPFNPPQFSAQSQPVKSHTPYMQLPPQPYYPPHFMYPMMPHPIGVPPGFPPYNIPPYMNPSQPYSYNMVGMPMQPMPQPMQQSMQLQMQQNMQQQQQTLQQSMQQPMPQNMQQPMQQNMQQNMQQSMQQAMPQNMQQSMQQPMQQPMQQQMRVMNPQIYSQTNGGHYQMNTKQKNYNSGQQAYQNQYRQNFNQTIHKQAINSSDKIQHQKPSNLVSDNYKKNNHQNEVQQRENPKDHEKHNPQRPQKLNSQVIRKKTIQEESKSIVRKQLKNFAPQQQLDILQIVKCLTKQSNKQSNPQNIQLAKTTYERSVNQLHLIAKQSEQKKESLYKILQALQFEWTLMALKERNLLDWAMKEKQFLKMGEIMGNILNTPVTL